MSRTPQEILNEIAQLNQEMPSQSPAQRQATMAQLQALYDELDTLKAEGAASTKERADGDGADIDGSVGTGGGDFIGRDQHVDGDVTGGDKSEGDMHKAGRDINNTYINQIIRRADSGLDEELARAELERYLEWVIAQNGTITLRGVQHQGRQVVEMPLDSVYVPLEAAMAFSRRDGYTSGRPKGTRVEGISPDAAPGPPDAAMALSADHEREADRMEEWPGEDGHGEAQRMTAGYGGRREMQLNEVLGHGERLIITGGPGCGKTTVLMHIAATLAEALAGNRPELVQEKLGLDPEDGIPLPILIPLNRYAAYRRRHQADPYKRTLAAYVSHYLIERCGLSALLHQLDEADFFQRLLEDGRQLILLLDGLDEVPNETERVKVTEAIENLLAGESSRRKGASLREGSSRRRGASLREGSSLRRGSSLQGGSSLRVVATCRTAAYEKRTVLGSRFHEVQVQPLNDDHVARLITQAYAAVYSQDEIKRRRQTAELLSGIREMEAARRQRMGTATEPLVSSPLLVRMMLLVHLNERRLPEQRAELYWKATENMLLPDYQSDTQVRETIGNLVGGKLRHLELVQHVAFYMHLRGQEVGREIDEHELKRLLARDETFADLVAEFIAVTRQRGTLMEENAGSYRFIHLGFQEFLVARYMAEVLLYEQRLTDFLAEEDRLSDSWWREPILLLAGYLAVTNTKQAEWLVRYLAGLPEEDEEGRKVERGAGGMWRWLSRYFKQISIEDVQAVALAGTAVIEWPNVRPGLRKAVMHKLEAVITGGDGERSLSSKQRAEFGRQLSVVGDPRPGVGVKDGLPDIVWGGVVPANRYSIGGDGKYDGKIQDVRIEQPYQLARYPVTNAQFDCFVNVPDFEDERWWLEMPPKYRADVKREPNWPLSNHPRVDVNWYEAVAFCRWLSNKLGYEVRLPHEYEWEVAACYVGERRTGRRLYPWGNAFTVKKANTEIGGVKQTTAVGLYPGGRQPRLDLYDMSGNVWEWCLNKHQKPDYISVDTTGDNRTMRGGSWGTNAVLSNISFRYGLAPNLRSEHFGFRLVRRASV